MSTFGFWLDSYDGADNIVAGVAQIWRTAKADEDARPRVSAVQSITEWLREHRGVADESLRAAVRAFNESRGGRQLTDADAAAFKAMNSPGTIAPVPGDHEQPAGPSPAVMAALGRIEQGQRELLARQEAIQRDLGNLRDWTHDQDERVKPITDLLGELAEAEQAPDQPELDGQQASEPPFPIRAEGEMGSLWAQIAAPEPDPERMAQLGDPRLVEDEG